MTKKPEDKVSYIESTTFLYRLDDQFRVIPVPMENLHESLAGMMEGLWGYQSKLDQEVLVSSVFLGVATPSIFNAQPLCFETMVFDSSGKSCWSARYRTIEGCISGHHDIVRLIEAEGEAAWNSDHIKSIFSAPSLNGKS